MITIGTGGTLLYNIGIDSLSIIIVLIVYISSKRWFSDTYDNRILCFCDAAVLFILMSDIIMWLLNGVPGMPAKIAGYADNIAYFILQILVACGWLRYSFYRIFLKSINRKKELIFIFIPMIIMALCTIVSPVTKWVFYIDSANYYHRGALSTAFAAVALVYIMSASVMALRQYGKEKMTDRKRELLVISLFPVIPFIGGFVQTLCYGCSILWPGTAAALLLIYVNNGNRAISQDSLTGMNNRRSLERFFKSYIDAGNSGTAGAIVMDINSFKSINDRFGHYAGDEALIRVSEIIRNVFSKTQAFLCRYGGDEFIAVFPEADDASMKEHAAVIKEAAEKNGACGISCTFSVSVGYAVGTVLNLEDAGMLIKDADRAMYIEKEKYHLEEIKQ
ncbi:MAG: GGDEF domain-containing protein [Eubacteriaceae bacterium]|jgi:diguanylate cyclase (GGDEF)-like protein|nr:GGDEF domain-containing protein [Eubacteriaceae bacterium]